MKSQMREPLMALLPRYSSRYTVSDKILKHIIIEVILVIFNDTMLLENFLMSLQYFLWDFIRATSLSFRQHIIGTILNLLIILFCVTITIYYFPAFIFGYQARVICKIDIEQLYYWSTIKTYRYFYI